MDTYRKTKAALRQQDSITDQLKRSLRGVSFKRRQKTLEAGATAPLTEKQREAGR